MIYLMNVITQICTAIALFLAYLANQWLTVGFGLNPWIALPLATLFMVVPHIGSHYLEEVDDDNELTCIVQKSR